MLSTQSILTHFQHIEPRLMDIVIELRNLVAEVKPDATETIHRKGLTYFDASRGGHVSAGICQILIDENHIQLAFIHGAFLPDPCHLLSAESGRIAKRYVRLDSYEDAPWGNIKTLIVASANFDPRSLAME
jgi:hypothetical protein